MPQLNINNARFLVWADPRNRLIAARVRGRQQRRDLGRNPKALVRFVVDAKVFQAARDRVLARDFHVNLFIAGTS